jgi:endonuclease/exonuclease/phosphatase family metal-dependent hydrolase
LSFHNYSQKSKCFASRNGKLRIDWIFVSKEFSVLNAGIRIDKEKEQIASDHFPIFATLQINRKN